MSPIRPTYLVLLQARAQALRRPLAVQALVPGRGRPTHTAPVLLRPYKDDQDRESLAPRSTEGSKSGSDSDAARGDEAFDPSMTRPEEEKEAAGRGSGSGANPLEVSGASHERSKPLGEDGGGEMKATTQNRDGKSSGGGGPAKHGKPMEH